MAWHFDDSVVHTIINWKCRQLTTIFGTIDVCRELCQTKPKNLKQVFFETLRRGRAVSADGEKRRERREREIADERRLGRYRRSVVGYVAVKLGGGNFFSFFLFSFSFPPFTSLLDGSHFFPWEREGVTEFKKIKANSCFCYVYIFFFEKRNVSWSIPSVLLIYETQRSIDKLMIFTHGCWGMLITTISNQLS